MIFERLDHALDGAGAGKLAAHLGECPDCRDLAALAPTALEALRSVAAPRILSAGHENALWWRLQAGAAGAQSTIPADRPRWRLAPALGVTVGVAGLVASLAVGRSWLRGPGPTPEARARGTAVEAAGFATEWRLRNERIQGWPGGRSAFVSYEINEVRPVRVSWYVRENWEGQR